MKLRKLLAAVVAVATALTASISVNANCLAKDAVDDNVIIDNAMYLVVFYCSEGGADFADGAPSKVANDYGFEVEKIGSLEATIKMNDADLAEWQSYFDAGTNVEEDQPSGSLVLSCNNNGKVAGATDSSAASAGTLSALEDTAMNWQTYEFWGFGEWAADPTLEDNTCSGMLTDNGDGTYTIRRDDCAGKLSSKGSLVQIGLQLFESDWDWEVVNFKAFDVDGNLVGLWDTTGHLVDGIVADSGAPTTGGAAPTTGGAAPTTGTAPTTGGTVTPPDTKGVPANPDTGVEGIAVVAGLAIIATGAIIVSKKRK